jgi:hypothetical protein
MADTVAVFCNAESGLVGTLGYRIIEPATGAVLVARTTAGVTALGSGGYVVYVSAACVDKWIAWSAAVGESEFGEHIDRVPADLVASLASITAHTNLIAAGGISVLPGPAVGQITVYRGDDYLAAQSRQLIWPLPTAADLSSAAVTLSVYAAGSRAALFTAGGTVTGGGTENQAVSVVLTAAQRALLTVGYHTAYSRLVANYGTTPAPQMVTVAKGWWIVRPAGAEGEMKMSDVIQLTEEWGCWIHSCLNAETVCDARDLEPFKKDGTMAAIAAGDKVLARHLDGDVSQSDSCFSNWHGGKHARVAISAGLFVADFCRRDRELDEDESAWTDWQWVPAAEVPFVLRLGLEAVLQKATAAAYEELDAWETGCTVRQIVDLVERIAADNARFAAEDAATESQTD